MTLQELLGDDLYGQVQAKIDEKNAGETDKLKHIRYADLSEGGYVSKDKYAGLENDNKAKDEELVKANELIKQLKSETEKGSKAENKIAEYEAEVEKLKAENELLKVDNALKFALKDAGAEDVDYLVYKAKATGDLKLDEDGKIKGIKDIITVLKTEHPAQFKTADADGEGIKHIEANTLPQGDDSSTVTKDKFKSMTYAERMEFKQANPEMYEKYKQQK